MYCMLYSHSFRLSNAQFLFADQMNATPPPSFYSHFVLPSVSTYQMNNNNSKQQSNNPNTNAFISTHSFPIHPITTYPSQHTLTTISPVPITPSSASTISSSVNSDSESESSSVCMNDKETKLQFGTGVEEPYVCRYSESK